MSNCIRYFSVLILCLITGIACEKDNDDSEISMVDIPLIEAAAISGEWKVTYYFDSDKEETSDYNGYTFDFVTDGVLRVSNDQTATSGVWSITHDSDSSSDDDSDDDSNDIDFNIILNNPPLLEELSDDWSIKSYSNTKIELMDISGGDGDTDYLTLEKV